MIGPFSGEYRYLSNFYPAPIAVHGLTYPTVEHFYQASKAATPDGYDTVMSCDSPAGAKRVGRHVEVRPDFEQLKRAFMMQGVLAKFTQHPDLRQSLLSTGEEALVEVNTWGDRYWGAVVTSDAFTEGENWLGRILMATRQLLS